MAKPNFSYEKRKKELDRKRKQEEKQHRKQARADAPDEEIPEPEQNTPASVDNP